MILNINPDIEARLIKLATASSTSLDAFLVQ